MTLLGIVSDDVTGGTTVGALLARVGTSPTVFYSPDLIARNACADQDAVIVSTDSRALSAEESYKAVNEATKALMALGAVQFSKRIDTTLRGGIGHEVEGMLDALGDDHVAVVVPAMPQSKKVVVGGFSLINSVPLSSTDVAHDVRTPVLTSDVRKLLQSQCDEPVSYIPLDDVLGGSEVIAAQMRLQRCKGSRIFVVDAATDEHIDWIAEAVAGLDWHAIAVDPGPFTVSLAIHRHVITPLPHVDKPIRLEQSAGEAGTVMVVACSATAVTHQQMVRLGAEKGTEVLTADPLLLISSDRGKSQAEFDRVIDKAHKLFSAGAAPRVLMLATDVAYLDKEPLPAEELAVASGLSANDASNLITKRFSELARVLADIIGPERCAGFYLTGGDTMLAVCKALETSGLRMTDYLIPQVDQSVLVGGPYAGLPVICKGGLTGMELTAVQGVNRVFDEQHVHLSDTKKELV
ncbi:four-carbon acid sugar kinase family protein [Bifidobacterium sp. ESL0790]|uniref:four-carbon acid sugar kinase family protein n=1 Tax=Bifidobacterium sp. ESL0790 TaxID=2983233 RepID=UPI0023F8C7FC|nr:four-carbon acid sugar kinase family protein [Bifidobacterium sp. ESL0790]WEV72024.1 four-carbon acid sugar kinase family protein [Bifidobacterium sp. ESL0790]